MSPRVVIQTNTSEKIGALTYVTLKNKRGYAAKHGYVTRCYDFDYENYNDSVKDYLFQTLKNLHDFDVVMTMGADTMFMNWRIEIEDVLGDEKIVMARERTGWWPINDDVMIWRSCPEVIAFYERLINDYPIWSKYPWRLQTHLWNLLQDDEQAQRLIKLVEPDVMNQHPSRWQLGQWVVHMYNMSIEDKIKQALVFDQNWPDGQPLWQIQSDAVRPGVI